MRRNVALVAWALLAVLAGAPVRADAVALDAESGSSCDALPGSICTTTANARPDGAIDLEARATAPAFGNVPGRATVVAWGEFTASIAHDGADAVSVRFDLAVDDAAVFDASSWGGSGLDGDGSVVAIIRVYQPGACCGTFHTRPIVRSARLGGTWWAPERLSATTLSLGGTATNAADPLPPGTVQVSIAIHARTQLRNELGGPGLGEIVASLRARIENLKVTVTPM